MSEDNEIEVGKTYEFEGWPEFYEGRKALVLAVHGGICEIRWANGMTSWKTPNHLRGPVAPARPGVDEACLLCGGTLEIAVQHNDPKKPWFLLDGGTEPCPNCTAP